MTYLPQNRSLRLFGCILIQRLLHGLLCRLRHLSFNVFLVELFLNFGDLVAYVVLTVAVLHRQGHGLGIVSRCRLLIGLYGLAAITGGMIRDNRLGLGKSTTSFDLALQSCLKLLCKFGKV